MCDNFTSMSDAFLCLVDASMQRGKFTLDLAQNTQGTHHRLETFAAFGSVFVTTYIHIFSSLSLALSSSLSFFFLLLVFLRQGLVL